MDGRKQQAFPVPAGRFQRSPLHRVEVMVWEVRLDWSAACGAPLQASGRWRRLKAARRGLHRASRTRCIRHLHGNVRAPELPPAAVATIAAGSKARNPCRHTRLHPSPSMPQHPPWQPVILLSRSRAQGLASNNHVTLPHKSPNGFITFITQHAARRLRHLAQVVAVHGRHALGRGQVLLDAGQCRHVVVEGQQLGVLRRRWEGQERKGARQGREGCKCQPKLTQPSEAQAQVGL